MTTIIINNIEYNMNYQENGDIILKPLLTIINKIEELTKYNFTKSIIIENKVNNFICQNKYKSIMNYIYKIINDGTQIIKNSDLNIKTIRKEDNGFYYIDKLGISVQGIDANKSIYEIYKQSNINNIKLYLKIKLENNTLLQINI
jgi:hypothetical protein